MQDKTMFPDSNLMKEQLRQQMVRPQYDVANFYKTEGFTQWLAKHPRFEHATYVLILLNAVWLAVETDGNPATILLDAPPQFQIAEHFFCACFTYELVVRFLAFEWKTNACRDAWFIFDLVLVSIMVFETWVITAMALASGVGGDMGSISILRLVRLLRLTRLARVARLFRAVPELLIIIRGLCAAVRSVVFTLTLLLSLIYVFAIAFTQLCAGTGCEASFPSVPAAMHTLLLNGALMDSLGSLVEPLAQQSPVLLLLFYAFLLLAAMTLMNMLIGVICEVVSAVAATEREAMTLVFVKERIKALMALGDDNADCEISKQEFLKLLSNKAATTILEDVGVDVVGLVDFADTIFEPDCSDEVGETQEKVLSFADFMGVVLDLRGTNTATLRDITQLRKHINGRFTRLEQKLLEILPTPQCASRSRGQLKKAATEPLGISPAAADEKSMAWKSSWGCLKDSNQQRPSNQLQALYGIMDTVIQQCTAEHERELEALRANIQSTPTGCTDMQSPLQQPSLLGICPSLPESPTPATSWRAGGRFGHVNRAPVPVASGSPEQRCLNVMPAPCGTPTLLSSSPARRISVGPPQQFSVSPSRRPQRGKQPVPTQPIEALPSTSIPGTPVSQAWPQQPATPARGLTCSLSC
jgi:hypothetical protein